MVNLPKFVCFALVISLGSSQFCPSDLDADVIIIGAGMAGIAAAERLQENGINNILILEGSNRVGGRAKSAQIGGASVSLGPGWVIGRDPADPGLHPLWKIAERCGGLRGFYPNYDSLINYDSQGNQPEEAQFRWSDYDTALTGAYNLAAQLQQSEQCDGVSVRFGLNESGWTPVTPTDNWIEWYNSDYPEGSPPRNQSLCGTFGNFDQSYTNFTSPGSGNEGVALEYFVSDPDGYEKLIKCMASEVDGRSDQTRTVFEAVVTKIDWSRDECVCVTATINGDATDYCSKYAIPTVSVGVLKAEEIQFVPELPDWKRDIINRFEISIFIHIVMEFGEAFWDTAQQIGYIDDDTKGLYPIFLNHNITFEENPKVLDVIVTGDVARRVSGQSKSDTIAEIEQILGTMYPTANVTVLDSVIGDWLSDPLFRGSFIHFARDLREIDFERLGEPVGNLYISGSATSVGFAGYVHGALFAGWESAEKVITASQTDSKAENVQTSIMIVLLGLLCALCY